MLYFAFVTVRTNMQKSTHGWLWKNITIIGAHTVDKQLSKCVGIINNHLLPQAYFPHLFHLVPMLPLATLTKARKDFSLFQQTSR